MITKIETTIEELFTEEFHFKLFLKGDYHNISPPTQVTFIIPSCKENSISNDNMSTLRHILLKYDITVFSIRYLKNCHIHIIKKGNSY